MNNNFTISEFFNLSLIQENNFNISRFFNLSLIQENNFNISRFFNLSLIQEIKEINSNNTIYFFIFNTSIIFILAIFYKCKNINFKKNNYNNLSITLDTYLDKANDKIKLLSSTNLSTEELINLKNNFIDEVTPLGLVKLSYDYNHDAFIYYSDEEIPYKYLEVVSRLFVIEYNCKSLYIDYKEQLFKARDLYFERKQQSQNNQINSVYAISKNKKLPENSNIYIVPEKSNKYIKKGKIKNLIEKNKIKEREAAKNKKIKEINFKDFKKNN